MHSLASERSLGLIRRPTFSDGQDRLTTDSLEAWVVWLAIVIESHDRGRTAHGVDGKP